LFNPKVSVIIPIYNVEKYIIQCLNSIIKQKLNEIEIIVVNDGSSDNSLQIALNFTNNDNRVLILSQINRGLSEARNTGVRYSRGEYIYFIDGDDYLDENCLFDLYNQAIKNNLDIVFFNAEPVLDDSRENINPKIMKVFKSYLLYYIRKGNYDGVLNGTEIFSQMVEENDYLSSVCLQFFKKKFYINEGLSFYPGILHEDNLFTFIAILLAKRTSYIKNIYYKRRIHINSIMTTTFNVKNLYGYFIV
jgi:glycosyltransferase involved in cell wall biosynthesis